MFIYFNKTQLGSPGGEAIMGYIFTVIIALLWHHGPFC
jgi:gamma-glutamyltranspeptidase